MKRLTNREEFIMKLLWEKGPLFVREMLPFFEEPQPHFNTVSTIVRGYPKPKADDATTAVIELRKAEPKPEA